MKKLLSVLLVLLLSASVFAGGSSESVAAGSGIAGTVDNPRMLRAGTSMPATTDTTSPIYIGEHALNDKLMELSGGTLGYECIYGGALGNNTQLLAQLRAGTLDLMPTGFDLATNLQDSEKFYAVAMPYVFDNDEHMEAFLASDLWDEMVAELAESNGIYISGLFYHQPARVFNTKRPIVHPEDLHGLKMRVPESTVQMDLWKAVGASPTVVPGSELYSSLDSGIVDGQENDLVSTVSLKLYEVAPYYTEVDYIKQAMLLYMSQKTWDAMSEEEKGWYNEALAYACEVTSQAYADQYEGDKQAIIDAGGTIVEFDYEEWKEFFTDIVHETFDGKYFPSGLYDEIQAIEY